MQFSSLANPNNNPIRAQHLKKDNSTRPIGIPILRLSVCQAGWLTAIGIHDKDFVIPSAIGGKHDFQSIC